MFSTIIAYGLSKTNYSLFNTNNHYNFIIESFELLESDKNKTKFIEKMKINIGNSFYNEFKSYCISKLSVSHDIIKYF